jgi:hypothetical protein
VNRDERICGNTEHVNFQVKIGGSDNSPELNTQAKSATAQNNSLKEVLGVMRVAFSPPVIISVGFPLMSYAWKLNVPV